MSVFSKIFNFYYQGFKQMTWGRTLWIIIIIKLFVMFAILKVFFFPSFLKDKGDKATYVRNQLIERSAE